MDAANRAKYKHAIKQHWHHTIQNHKIKKPHSISIGALLLELFYNLHFFTLPFMFLIGRQLLCRSLNLSRRLNPLKGIPADFFSFVDFMVIVPSFLQFLNAFPPISAMPFPRAALLSFVQPSNADAPITFTLSPVSALAIFLLFLNALPGTAVTLKSFPLIFTVFRPLIFVTLLPSAPVTNTVDVPVALYW